MIKRILLVAVVMVGGLGFAAPQADAGIVIGRVAPVRRVVGRTVLPPYPVARRAVVGPVFSPWVHPAHRPVMFAPAPMIYRPGVTVWVR